MKALKASIPEKDLILNQKNLGYAGGNNVGIKIAIKNGADFIFIVNPDIRLENNTIPMLVEWMESNPRLASVGPRICFRDNPELIYSDGGIVEPERGYATWHLHFGKKIGEVQSQKYTDVDYVNGSAILLRTEALKHIGPFGRISSYTLKKLSGV
ncbi:MAG: glycosyltransferase family 2 protein [Saprospirales bacterium]|nr:glycosyltransferase family 2 protein [Saprospirales bacterium]